MAYKRQSRTKPLHRCPTCGGTRIRTIVGDYRTHIQGQDIIVPQLEREECPDCGEVLFGPASMRRMEGFRKPLSKSTKAV